MSCKWQGVRSTESILCIAVSCTQWQTQGLSKRGRLRYYKYTIIRYYNTISIRKLRMQVKSKDWQKFGGWTREAEHGEPLWQYWRKEGVWMESMTMGVGMSGSGEFFFLKEIY